MQLFKVTQEDRQMTGQTENTYFKGAIKEEADVDCI